MSDAETSRRPAQHDKVVRFRHDHCRMEEAMTNLVGLLKERAVDGFNGIC